MVNLRQFVLSLFTMPFSPPAQELDALPSSSKSVAIVGAGSAGLAMLKTILDLPEATSQNWDIVLYDQRRNVGGVWLPDPNPVSPPRLPETPLYPRLHTNTPVPSMTYPGFTFPPGTPLYPSHEHIEWYHQDYVKHFNLGSHIKFNHTVVASSWVGTPEAGHWNITVRDNDNEHVLHKSVDHLVVAAGNNHYPHIVSWPGQEEWLANTSPHGPRREILHSVWYREPEKYAGQTVVIVGSGASGRDAALQVGPIARKAYLAARTPIKDWPGVVPIGNETILKPGISHFTASEIVFEDNTTAPDVDSVILGTGYEVRVPFLQHGDALVVNPSVHSNDTYTEGLVTNLRYLFPLHKHIFSLCPSYPTTALAFIGLPSLIANCPADIAQSLYVAHSILNPSLLPPREELLAELAVQEEELRQKGFDPYHSGHRLVDGSGSDYQDELVGYLKSKGAIPDDGRKYVEEWRRALKDYQYLRRGWQRVEASGIEGEWLDGVETEEEWASLMERLNKWQGDWEEQQGIPFVRDWDLVGY